MEPTLTRVTLTLCSLCLSGAGGICHVPGCALCRKAAPDVPLTEIADYERVPDEPAATVVVAGLADLTRPGSDSADGFDRAPDRYTAHGRETIDRMRDLAHTFAAMMRPGCTRAQRDDLADDLFAFHCFATALKYEDRAGLKGDANTDARKAAFYRGMAAHVAGEGPDPRAARPGFVPYRRPSEAPATCSTCGATVPPVVSACPVCTPVGGRS